MESDVLGNLKRIHKQLEQWSQGGNEKDARMLQTFFNDVIKFINQPESNKGKKTMSQVLALLTAEYLMEHNPNVGPLLFQRQVNIGAALEEDLATVIKAAIEAFSQKYTINTNEIKIDTIQTGGKPATVEYKIYKEVADGVVEDYVQEYYIQHHAKAQEAAGSVAIPAKQQKIDITGPQIEFDLMTGEKLPKIVNLLNHAAFSAKSSISSRSSLKLGDSNIERALTGALSALKVPNPRQECYNIITAYQQSGKEDQQSIGGHIYHLRYFYELTGAGQGEYVDGKFQHFKTVNYLIYGNPKATQDRIKVLSVREIMSPMLSIETRSSPFTRIKLSKRQFHSTI